MLEGSCSQRLPVWSLGLRVKGSGFRELLLELDGLCQASVREQVGTCTDYVGDSLNSQNWCLGFGF